MIMKSSIFENITFRPINIERRFGRTHSLRLQRVYGTSVEASSFLDSEDEGIMFFRKEVDSRHCDISQKAESF
jgi:hypothetical protein